jgi:hypothetical protein
LLKLERVRRVKLAGIGFLHGRLGRGKEGKGNKTREEKLIFPWFWSTHL